MNFNVLPLFVTNPLSILKQIYVCAHTYAPTGVYLLHYPLSQDFFMSFNKKNYLHLSSHTPFFNVCMFLQPFFISEYFSVCMCVIYYRVAVHIYLFFALDLD